MTKQQNIIHITDSDFVAITQSNTPVLIDFWAPWCRSCITLDPTIEELAVEYSNRLSIFKLNVDHHSQAPTIHNVKSIPTLMIFKNGQALERVTGSTTPKSVLKEKIEKHL